MWVIQENVTVGWYVWLIAALALLLGTLTGQHFFASYKEMEPKAAWMGVLVMGVPTLILAGVASWLFLTS
jgi:4-amino-4-deoxy-L-arabinose transferase-like glycosyltransferase